MPSRRCLVTAIAGALFALLASAGAAHPEKRIDPDDGTGPLDLRSVTLSHDSSSYTIRFATYEPWRSRLLYRPVNGLSLFLDVNQSAESDCQLVVAYGRKADGNKGLKIDVFDRIGADCPRRPVVLRRTDPRSVTIRFELSVEAVRTLRWRPESYSKFETGYRIDSIPGLHLHVRR